MRQFFDVMRSSLGTLSRRERQIMEVLYEQERATVVEVHADLPDAPASTAAVRTTLGILERKGLVTRETAPCGRERVYSPTTPRPSAGRQALQTVLETFYQGSMEDALAAHLGGRGGSVDEEALKRMEALIRDAREARTPTRKTTNKNTTKR